MNTDRTTKTTEPAKFAGADLASIPKKTFPSLMSNSATQPDSPGRNFIITAIVTALLLGLIAAFATTLRHLHRPAVAKRTGTYCTKNLATACVDLSTGHYFIPQGDAHQTMYAFFELSRQLPFDGSYAGIGIVSDDIFIGRRTQELNGRFSPSEALDRMLQGSGLERDEHNRVITIKRIERNSR